MTTDSVVVADDRATGLRPVYQEVPRRERIGSAEPLIHLAKDLETEVAVPVLTTSEVLILDRSAVIPDSQGGVADEMTATSIKHSQLADWPTNAFVGLLAEVRDASTNRWEKTAITASSGSAQTVTIERLSFTPDKATDLFRIEGTPVLQKATLHGLTIGGKVLGDVTGNQVKLCLTSASCISRGGTPQPGPTAKGRLLIVRWLLHFAATEPNRRELPADEYVKVS